MSFPKNIQNQIHIWKYKITTIIVQKKVLQQISILTKTIHDKVDKNGAVKHYIEDYGHVPLFFITFIF